MDQELAHNNLVRKEISTVYALKKSLSEYGYTLRDTAEIPKLLKEINVCGGDVNIFFERAREVRDIKWQLKGLEERKGILEPVVDGLASRGHELEKKHDARFQVVFEAIKKLMAPSEKPKRPIGFQAPKK